MEASIGGTLDLGSGCASVRRGEESIALLWSGDAHVEAGTPPAVLFNGSRLEAGSKVSLGGGFADPRDWPGLAQQIAQGSCEGRFFLVQTVQR